MPGQTRLAGSPSVNSKARNGCRCQASTTSQTSTPASEPASRTPELPSMAAVTAIRAAIATSPAPAMPSNRPDPSPSRRPLSTPSVAAASGPPKNAG
jgi:hypothetical protein